MNVRKSEKQQRSVICLLSTFLIWVLLIFLLSTQNGPQTAHTSEGIAHSIAKLMYGVPDAAQIHEVHMAVRKAAHIVLFFVLGILTGVVCMRIKREWPVVLRFAAGYAFVLFYSFFDEWHKQFIVGRHNQLGDALLNVLGCSIGIAMAAVIYKIKECRQRGI